jgi:hypothetical protein
MELQPYATPFIGACVIVFVYYLMNGKPDPTDPSAQSPSYFVVFCGGLVFSYMATQFLSTPENESINNVLAEIDLMEPSF